VWYAYFSERNETVKHIDKIVSSVKTYGYRPNAQITNRQFPLKQTKPVGRFSRLGGALEELPDGRGGDLRRTSTPDIRGTPRKIIRNKRYSIAKLGFRNFNISGYTIRTGVAS
jgi:hypothetical protein